MADGGVMGIGGGVALAGVGAGGYAAYELHQARQVGAEHREKLELFGRGAADELTATGEHLAKELDQSLQEVRGPVNELVDHVLDSPINGPVKLVKYVEEARAKGRVANETIDAEIDIARILVRSHSEVAKEQATAAFAQAKTMANELVTDITKPLGRGGVAAIGGVVLLAAGLGAGIVGAAIPDLG